jgi:transposase InsO family protein
MLNNWLDQLLDYNFTIIHMPGVLNILPDKISRLYDADPLPEVPPRLFTGEVLVETLDPEHGDPPPMSARSGLISRAHLMGHFGSAAIIKALIINRTTWPLFRQDVQRHVSSCLECQRFNIGKHGFHPLKTISAALPFDHVAIDLKQLPASAAGYNYILVIVDLCTRFVFLRPLKNKSMHSVSTALLEVFLDVGFPKILQSDNGTEFVNQIISEICQTASIDLCLSSSS